MEVTVNEKKKEDFTAREYQVDIIEQAKLKNVIIFLPTGSGKTFIAIKIIEHFSSHLVPKYSLGGKRALFLVNNVALVSQQATAIRRHLPFEVGEYCGEMNVNYWEKDRWDTELEKHEVLVMTAQIYLDMLQHGYINMSSVSIIIFDECHHAVGNQPMRQIMMFYFEMNEQRPRIVGLTASLLNSNVKPHKVVNEVKALELTFDATVIRAINQDMVLEYSSNPKEKVLFYNTSVSSGQEGYLLLHESTEYLLQILDLICFTEEEISIINPPTNAALLTDSSKSLKKKLSNMIKDAVEVIKDLGLYAATCVILLSKIIGFERMKVSADDTLFPILNTLTTELQFLRKRLMDLMEEVSEKEALYTFSTDKVLKLLCILKKFPPEQSVIVFVTRRSTAQALHFLLKDLKKIDSDFENIKSDFIVGYNSGPSHNIEAQLGRKINRQIMKRFRSRDINLLFASEVVEEGIDVQTCNFVIKFDLPVTFRSYTQSKGRARHKESNYILMVPKDEDSKFNDNYSQFIKTEDILKKILCEGTEKWDDIEGENMDEDFEDEDDLNCFFSPPDPEGGPRVTAVSAISLLNRYCCSLPQDRFVKLNVVWWLGPMNENGKCSAILQLPINSAIKRLIEGPPRKNKLSAKRLAALQACKLLYVAGELDSHLLPCGNKSQLLNDQNLFPKYKNEKGAGSKKLSRLFFRHIPKWMQNCAPTPDSETYFHVIKITPNYDLPQTDRLIAFYKLLKDDSTFAILSSVKWPKVCSLPLFMNIGEVKLEMLMNNKKVVFTQKEIKAISDFHCMLFTEVWPLVKNLAVKDVESCDENYCIAPVLFDNKTNSYEIDWKVIKTEKKFPVIKYVPPKDRLTCEVNDKSYLNKVVIPWYRTRDNMLKYIVTKVRYDQNPDSPFPTTSYKSFSHYFKSQYEQIRDIHNSEQPLLEVRAISSKNNCLRPRGKHRSRNNRDEDHFEETLVPELCYLLTFPAVYMLKLTLVPSLLHRLHYLLVAEEFRIKFAQKTGFGVVNLPEDFEWDPIVVDKENLNLHEEEDEIDLKKLFPLKTWRADLDNDIFPWDCREEPSDINREIDIDMTSILHYVQFTSNIQIDVSPVINIHDEDLLMIDYFNINVEPLSVLQGSKDNLTPQLKEILMALTSAKADDIMDYERHETLGDSFLKFAVSLALFTYFKDKDEGKLTQIKGKILGNANLFYCGVSLGLGTYIKVNPFTLADWKVPGFYFPKKLKELLRDSKLSLSMLTSVSASNKEVDNGMLSEETFDAIMKCMSTEEEDESLDPIISSAVISDNFSKSSDTNYFHGKICKKALLKKDECMGYQDVPDKCISDMVEALISVYLQTFGVEGGFKFLEYADILPKNIFNINYLLYSDPECPLLSSGSFDHHLKNPDKLEKTLGYRFKNRGFLLQALTHPSYNHGMTDCYQRFEFLGDALLDFLITAYIYEKYNYLSPGQLTDLRSALVNNVTFACLTVKYKFHTYLLSMGCTLTGLISRFVNYQEARNHEIGTEVLYLIQESDVKVAESIDVPKVLGDIFESLAAAVYLDSGKNMNTVWGVFYNLMKKELETFGKDIPLNPVRVLYQTFINPPLKFGTPTVSEFGVILPLEVIHNDVQMIFHGLGENKSQAKLAAAKQALKHFDIQGWL